MKKAILAALTFAALSGVQAGAMAYENLPEAQVGSGGTPDATPPPSTTDSFQAALDLFGGTDTDAPNDVNADNDPEPNVGDGSR